MLGYEELFKFLNLLGTVFGWVASDIDAKMEILRGLKNGEQSEKYQSVQSMIQYEVDNNLIKHKAKDSSTGTRNLLRLHRALEYIVAFLDGKPLLIFFSFLEEEKIITIIILISRYSSIR